MLPLVAMLKLVKVKDTQLMNNKLPPAEILCDEWWRRSGAVRFHMLSLQQKLAHTSSRPGVEATAILATKIMWWHGNRDCGGSQYKVWIAFNEQNIGSCGEMVASCYNHNQAWLCVYCWCHTPSGVVSPWGDHVGAVIARQHPREFDTNNTHTIMFDPLNTFLTQ